MRKNKFIVIMIIVAVILSAFCLNVRVFATDIQDDSIKEGARTSVDAGNAVSGQDTVDDDGHNHSAEQIEIHDGDLYVFFNEGTEYADTYTMDKNVDGNVFIFGKDVKITGEVNGSLFVFASTVTLEKDAYINCHTFICADTINMKGFTFDMYAACKKFNMESSCVIYRDLKLMADSCKFSGKIGRDVNLAATNIEILQDEDNKPFVGSKFNYVTQEKIENIKDIMTINGEVEFTKAKENEEKTGDNVVSDYVYKGIENSVFTLIIYALLIFLTPKFVEKSKEYISSRSLLIAAIGLAFTILLPIIGIILFITLVGIPLALALIMAYVIVLMINSAVVAIAINEFIANEVSTLNATWKKLLLIIPVSLILFIIRQIPVIGGWMSAIIFLVGVGITIIYQFDKRKKETETVSEE